MKQIDFLSREEEEALTRRGLAAEKIAERLERANKIKPKNARSAKRIEALKARLRAELAASHEARNRVVMNFYPWICQCAKRYSRKAHDDLVSHAVIMCLDKFSLFDPDRGIRPMTYFCHVAERQMQRYLQQDGLIRRPILNGLQYLPETIRRAEQAKTVLSISRPVSGLEGERAVETGTWTESKEIAPDELAADNESMDNFHARLAWLPSARDRFVVRMYVLHEKTLREIAAHLGITKERVRQIKDKSLLVLQRGIESGRKLPEKPLRDEEFITLPQVEKRRTEISCLRLQIREEE